MAVDKKFFVDINLQGNALNNATIGSNSDMTKGGSFRFDGTRLEYYDGSSTQSVANLADIAAVTGGLILQGGYDAATNTPNIADGTALKGFFWVVTEAGSFLGESVQVGDSIIAKVDNAGASIGDWLILQGNVVIATDTVDGIVRLATQAEVDAGTEGGAVVVTPATLQSKIDSQITPVIDSKLPLSGGTMSGGIDMGNNTIDNVSSLEVYGGARKINLSDADNNISLYSNNGYVTLDSTNLNLNNNSIVNVNGIGSYEVTLSGGTVSNVPAPTNGGDAANKTYVDDAANTAQSNAEATASADATAKADAAQAAAESYADSLAPNYDAAGSAAQALTDANSYTDSQITAQTFSGTYADTDWTLSGGVYTLSVAHSVSTSTPKVASYVSGNLVEFAVVVIDANTIELKSNIAAPAFVSVGVSK